MKVIRSRNINDAYYKGLKYLRQYGTPSPSRAGDVIVAPCPVTTVYARPVERVLFDATRDANPFFHVFEAIWMLSGSNDATWLDQFVKDFSSRFAEEGGIQHGAYGHRWRTAFGFDQLDVIVEKLRKDPNDRQCVLQMWDTTVVHLVNHREVPQPEFSTSVVGQNDLQGVFKDKPCNTQAYFRVQEVREEAQFPAGAIISRRVLDITVCCRSNDAIWGCYGANAVHFSVLQEYMAARIGVGVGTYYQISNNFHAYVGELERCKVAAVSDRMFSPYNGLDQGADMVSMPIVTDPMSFDTDLENFMAWTHHPGWPSLSYNNSWFLGTATPLFVAARLWRQKDRQGALRLLLGEGGEKMAPDWKAAAVAWMQRRLAKAKETA